MAEGIKADVRYEGKGRATVSCKIWFEVCR